MRVRNALRESVGEVTRRGGVQVRGVVERAGQKWPAKRGSVRLLPLLPRVRLIHSAR